MRYLITLFFLAALVILPMAPASSLIPPSAPASPQGARPGKLQHRQAQEQNPAVPDTWHRIQ